MSWTTSTPGRKLSSFGFPPLAAAFVPRSSFRIIDNDKLDEQSVCLSTALVTVIDLRILTPHSRYTSHR